MVREIKILNDNKTSLILTKNPKSQNQIKNIEVMHYYIRKLIKDGKLPIDLIESSRMLADGLTKTLSTAPFKRH